MREVARKSKWYDVHLSAEHEKEAFDLVPWIKAAVSRLE